jgi:hypothetical protein
MTSNNFQFNQIIPYLQEIEPLGGVRIGFQLHYRTKSKWNVKFEKSEAFFHSWLPWVSSENPIKYIQVFPVP